MRTNLTVTEGAESARKCARNRVGAQRAPTATRRREARKTRAGAVGLMKGNVNDNAIDK
jgi:hypothetical protein